MNSRNGVNGIDSIYGRNSDNGGNTIYSFQFIGFMPFWHKISLHLLKCPQPMNFLYFCAKGDGCVDSKIKCLLESISIFLLCA